MARDLISDDYYLTVMGMVGCRLYSGCWAAKARMTSESKFCGACNWLAFSSRSVNVSEHLEQMALKLPSLLKHCEPKNSIGMPLYWGNSGVKGLHDPH